MQITSGMGVTQLTVANLEKSGKDVRLMILKRYVEAAGCKLRLNIEPPDGHHKRLNYLALVSSHATSTLAKYI